jgi:DNA-directed RNA polymerase subunit alpha
VLLQTSEVKIKKVSEKTNTAVFEFEPLPSGFGRTLGSSLRRVLLTSLRGAAVTQVKIPSVAHQFSTITGVKEDVVEICLNLKEVRVKAHSNNPIIGRIEKKGAGPVTAGDIQISSEVEIINKDQHIAQLSDKNSKFEAEITVEPGVGYSPVEDRKTTKVGVILVDAVFSPVMHVSYDVQPTRKGEVSGLDKLILEVTTDGSVSSEDAVTEASTLLRNFFARFSSGPDEEVIEEISADGNSETAHTAATSAKDEVLIEDLSLPTRTVNALKKANIDTLGRLGKMSDDEIADIKNLGDKSVKEVKKLLKKEGYR